MTVHVTDYSVYANVHLFMQMRYCRVKYTYINKKKQI